jgi:hypothetical protein
MCCIIVTKNPFLTYSVILQKKQMSVINARKKKRKNPKKDVLGGA